MPPKNQTDKTTEKAIGDLREKFDLEYKGPRVVVSSGTLGIDIATRIGGIPRGCIVDLYGEEGLGKTTLALTMMAERIRAGERCIYLDVEHRLDPELVGIIAGEDVDYEKLVMQPRDAEAALTEVLELSRLPEVRMIVLDSVAALVPKHCIEETEKEQTAEISRMMSSHLKQVGPVRYANGTIIMYINQIRSRPMAIGPVTSQPTGGRALKFYSSLRMNIIRNSYIRVSEEVIGQRVDIIVEKNSFGAPHGRATMSIVFGEGVDKMRELIDWGLEMNLIRKSSSWYYYELINDDGTKTELKGNGEVALIEEIRPHFTKVYDQMRKMALSDGTTKPESVAEKPEEGK